MTSVQVAAVSQELAELRATVARLEEAAGGGAPQRRRRRPWRQRAGVLAGLTLAAATMMGIAIASTPGHPADVTFIALSVPHKILSNASIAKTATNSTAVIGGATTVPTDATSVQLTVAVKSAAAGSLSVFPTDHPTSTTADTISFAAGNVVTTQVSKQSPGLSSKVSFRNNGTATAVVTVTVTGYSTQTTASNISGSGGVAGQVLTNTGAGATWQPAGHSYAYAQPTAQNLPIPASGTTVASLIVPAGSYLVTFGGAIHATTSSISFVGCALFPPSLSDGRQMDTSATMFGDSWLAGQTLLSTSVGGQIFVTCNVNAGPASISEVELIATTEGSVTGAVLH